MSIRFFESFPKARCGSGEVLFLYSSHHHTPCKNFNNSEYFTQSNNFTIRNIGNMYFSKKR
jgi:hypothetical protein